MSIRIKLSLQKKEKMRFISEVEQKTTATSHFADETVNSDEYLAKCQVDTPHEFVEALWKIVHTKRNTISTVVDFGAGDGRFSSYGTFKKYVGFEIDEKRFSPNSFGKNVKLKNECAFGVSEGGFDLCIGNPPFVRHHDINKNWFKRVANTLENDLQFRVDGRSNAFLLFLCKALVATHENGLIALVIPFEWVSRPSAAPIRKFIESNGWDVDVYRFTEDIFDGVMTTASFTIIDKSKKDGAWRYHKMDPSFQSERQTYASGDAEVFEYVRRGDSCFAQRGLSPGGQNIFCLTEGQRIHNRLQIGKDVVPCVTSLKHLPEEFQSLTEFRFNKYYVEAGKRCWLLNTWDTPSTALMGYLNSIPDSMRNNYTCNIREVWWKAKPHQPADIIYSSAFVGTGPKFFENKVSAVAVGTVQGIHNVKSKQRPNLVKALSTLNFQSGVVAHSGRLKKIEVGQMNKIVCDMVETL
ncbi:N-6 DNA methylase [Undibacterium sp. CY18W]|uniref:site-specific DNA-methyltransferase (adenine-specific) n=1 Tax=Undibacterium hunanense TaxID=2762292 RepID=A0ABR6ZXC3_9BURK|nr:N-6 DNA methylase [Undibacterium hunanense]